MRDGVSVGEPESRPALPRRLAPVAGPVLLEGVPPELVEAPLGAEHLLPLIVPGEGELLVALLEAPIADPTCACEKIIIIQACTRSEGTAT